MASILEVNDCKPAPRRGEPDVTRRTSWLRIDIFPAAMPTNCLHIECFFKFKIVNFIDVVVRVADSIFAVGYGGINRVESSSDGSGRRAGHEGLRGAEQRTKRYHSYAEALSGNQKEVKGKQSFADTETMSMKFKYHMGECSKKAQDMVDIGPGISHAANRPNRLPPIDMGTNEEEGTTCEESGLSMYGTMVPETDLDPISNGHNQQDPLILASGMVPDQFIGRDLIEFDAEFE
ncbi:hypothetical protein QYF36_018663 [Acer negundo]|nr:hypothetical protein QYF36_018663 [Acer negundo]